MVKLSILDYAQIDEGRSNQEAIEDSVKLAKEAEQLGFHRFWVAEHHNVPAFASSSPELLMMHLANNTSTIKIGSGGIMLPHYSPYKIAENIRMLQAAHPNRIDLGFGNSPGVSDIQAALNEHKERLSSKEQAIKDLKHYLTDDKQEDFRFKNITANPDVDEIPEFWTLSMSIKSAKFAAEQGIAYCHGFFPYGADKDEQLRKAKKAVEVYRENFKPSSIMDEPKVMYSFFAAISDTEGLAEAVAKSIDLWMLGQNNFTRFKEIPSVETAKTYTPNEKEQEQIELNRSRLIVGTSESVKDQLDFITNELNADEILLCTIMPGIDNRINGIKELAKAYQLER